MRIEQLQGKLKSSLDHFVSLGNVLRTSYPILYPSEKGTLMYALLMAGRRLSNYMVQAHGRQKIFIPDVTGLDLIKTRGELLNLMSYLEYSDCDLGIAYSFNDASKPIFEPDNIVMEENADSLFPPKEQAKCYVNARILMIENSTGNYSELDECIKGVNDKIDEILADSKTLKHDEKVRMERFKAMEDFYREKYWKQDREQLVARIKGELDDEDNRGKSETAVLQVILKDITSDNITSNRNQTLSSINMVRDDREKAARLFADNRTELSVEDAMSHFKFREYDRLIKEHMDSKSLLIPCEEYQGKLFKNKAALEFSKLIKSAVGSYVGFNNKMNAAFLFYAMRDLGLVFNEKNNATLMVDYMKDVYGVGLSPDTITKPLRKCNGGAFCMIDENNLRGLTDNEFLNYKEHYWRCYSIINKVLAIQKEGCAGYLKQLLPAIASEEVFNSLEEEEKSRLYFLASVIRGDTLMF